MDTFHFANKTQAQAWAKKFAGELARPCVVLLAGELGAGKTQMVRWFLEALGVRDAMSPTFAIHQEHETPSGAIDHVDLYRLKSDADLESSGFWDLFQNPQGLVFVEWADRLPQTVWPKHWSRLKIELNKGKGDEERVARVTRL